VGTEYYMGLDKGQATNHNAESVSQSSVSRLSRVINLMELRTARRIAKLTQLELAKLADVDDSLISLIESGKRDISGVGYERVVRIARALNVTPEELFPVAPRDDARSA